jgi:hypothetical protein
MKMSLIIFIMVLVFPFRNFAQTLPSNTCGIVYSYDASGNRVQQKYVCNNGLRMYKPEQDTIHESIAVAKQVNALYPNPTTGFFKVTFTQPLKDAVVIIYDINGRVVSRFKKSGDEVAFNISSFASGVYILQIEDKNSYITQKVIKQ